MLNLIFPSDDLFLNKIQIFAGKKRKFSKVGGAHPSAPRGRHIPGHTLIFKYLMTIIKGLPVVDEQEVRN